MSFKNKVVLVTGSGSGIGAAVAKLFSKEGANVIIVDWNEERANNTAEDCKEFGNKVLVVTADVSKNEDAERIIKETIDTFGRLDVLINNAGIVREGRILHGNIMDTYDETMNINLRAVVLMTSLSAPHLVKTKGCIVNTSSVSSTQNRVTPMYPIYCVSKAGIDSFTRSAAIELGEVGLRVNAVNPGPVRTNILVHASISGNWNEIINATVLKKSSDPEEIADLILYLSSDKAKSVTGACFVIDNGMAVV